MDVCLQKAPGLPSSGDISKLLDKFQSELDAFEASRANGLANIPILNAMVSKLTTLLGAYAATPVDAIVKNINDYIEKQTKGVVDTGLAYAVTGLTTIANTFTEGYLIGASLLTEQLRKQIAIRLYYYVQLVYHFRKIRDILAQYYYVSANPNMIRVKYSKQQVLLALKATMRLRAELRDFGVWNIGLYRRIFFQMQTAVTYLTDDRASTAQFLSMLKIKDKANFSYVSKMMQQQFNQKILGDQLRNVDIIIWHSLQIALLSTIPAVTPYAITAGLQKTFPGYTSPNFRPDALAAERDLFLKTISSSMTYEDIFSLLDNIDKLKGLQITNAAIDTLVGGLRTFEPDWSQLQATTMALYQAMVPLQDGLLNVYTSMDDSVNNNDSTLQLTGKIPLWIGALQGLSAYQSLFTQAGIQQERLAWNGQQSFEAIVEFLNNDYIKSNDNRILDNMAGTLETIMKAPLQSRWLGQALIASTYMIRELEKAVNFNQLFYAVVADFDVSENPLAAELNKVLGQFMDFLSQMPPPVNAIGAAIMSGDLISVVAALNSLMVQGQYALQKFQSLGENCINAKSLTSNPEADAAVNRFYKNNKNMLNTNPGRVNLL